MRMMKVGMIKDYDKNRVFQHIDNHEVSRICIKIYDFLHLRVGGNTS